MTKRTLTVRLEPDLRAGLRAFTRKAKTKTYRGEELTFDTAGTFFGRLTERRWDVVRTLPGKAHIDLLELGLIERAEGGWIICPFVRIHVDFELAVAP